MQLSHRPPSQVQVSRRLLRHPRQGGYVMTVFGLMLVPLLLMVGLAVDVGYWYNRASDIQKAADAASLAGVVWLPNVTTATSVALDVAKRNGFDDADPYISVTVTKSTKAPRRLNVKITDSRVGSFFYKNLGGRNIGLTRSSFAEYVTPVPMGSPRNYFGTGRLLSGASQELLYQSINPYCTDKVNGDQHQSGYFGGVCSGSVNADYRTTGYELYLEAPAGRTSNIEVRLYDPRYNPTSISTQVPNGQTCTVTYAANWTLVTSNMTLTGPAQYQTRSSPTGSWSSTRTLATGATAALATNLGQYKAGTESCVPAFTTVTENGIDSKRQSGDEDYTFRLFSADGTPLDDTDNPLVSGCTKTYTKDTAFEYSYLNSNRWNTLCTITTAMPSGRYILRGTNGAPGTATADGSNQYGVVARYTSASGDGLCDGRSDPTCPRVYGKDAISVYANTSATAASFFLAEIGPEHVGKKLKLDLWDPGEGGQSIQIMRPTGTSTWTAATFSWKEGTGSTTTGSSLDVTSSRFNGKLVEITVDLTGYSPPADNNWWQIRYTFGSGTVTDRTTWSARILGDPVHLVEEN